MAGSEKGDLVERVIRRKFLRKYEQLQVAADNAQSRYETLEGSSANQGIVQKKFFEDQRCRCDPTPDEPDQQDAWNQGQVTRPGLLKERLQALKPVSVRKNRPTPQEIIKDYKSGNHHRIFFGRHAEARGHARDRQPARSARAGKLRFQIGPTAQKHAKRGKQIRTADP